MCDNYVISVGVELDSTPLLKSAKSAFSRTSAKSCSHRHGYPDIIAPPLHAREEAKQRYKLSSAETGRSTQHRVCMMCTV